jgi:hypothetical protein
MRATREVLFRQKATWDFPDLLEEAYMPTLTVAPALREEEEEEAAGPLTLLRCERWKRW